MLDILTVDCFLSLKNDAVLILSLNRVASYPDGWLLRFDY